MNEVPPAGAAKRCTMDVWSGQTRRMDIAYRLDRLRADGERLVEAAASDPSALVPGCPEWTTTDLLGHMGRVWRMLGLSVRRLSLPSSDDPRPAFEIPEPPTGDALIDFALAGLSEVVAVLTDVDPDAAGFYIRRAHLETLLHRVDAERAVDSLTAITAADAADAVDELTSIAYRGDELPNGSLHLHQTDGDGEWMIEVVDGAVEVRREHAKGDAALRGTGEELMLVMWGRRSIDDLDFFGDRSIIEEWIGLAP